MSGLQAKAVKEKLVRIWVSKRVLLQLSPIYLALPVESFKVVAKWITEM